MATFVHCSLLVEVNGKALQLDKKAKNLGVEVADVGSSGALLRVLGAKRDIRLAAQDVQQVSDSKIDDGRLAFVARNGLKVIMTKAQPAQLHMVLQRLRGGASKGGLAMGGACQKSAQTDTRSTARRIASPAVAILSNKNVVEGGNAPAKILRASLADLGQDALIQIWEFSIDPRYTLAKFAEACESLSIFATERQHKFRINPSMGSIAVSTVVARVSKRPRLEELDLSWWSQLTAGAMPKFANVLQGTALRKLSLRGCKALSEASIKRVLEACPKLEVLDLLEIPRLSNNALAVPFKHLRVLAAGSLGRQAVAERPSTGEKFPVQLTMLGAQAAVGSGPPQKRLQCAVNFTVTLLTRLTRGMPTGNGDGSDTCIGAPLTHLVLPNCSEIEVLTRLPSTLQHLDIRGANLQVPVAAVPGWKPLSNCRELQVLCLANNSLLCAEALLACIASLAPSSLRVLDVSGTHADTHLCRHLITSQQMITHLRLSGCTSLGMLGIVQVTSWLRGLFRVEILDIAGCYIDEFFGQDEHTDRDTPSSTASSLRFLGVGQIGGRILETARRAIGRLAPSAQVVGGSLDIFESYKALPPNLL
jgi:hypothetical protein